MTSVNSFPRQTVLDSSTLTQKVREEKGFMDCWLDLNLCNGESYNISVLHSVTLSAFNGPHPAQQKQFSVAL